MCEDSLADQLTIESVSEMLLLADRHSAAKLKTACIEYISENASEVAATKGWKVLTKSSNLVTELFLELAVKKRKTSA